MSFESGVTFFIAILIFGVTPGPGVFAILARALTQGAHSCWLLALGMSISDMLYLIAACFGLAVIANQWSEVFTVVRFAGAAYLIYLGYKMWTAPLVSQHEQAEQGKPNLQQNDTHAKNKYHTSFLQGFLISASNPKVILFYIAFLPTFMDLTRLSAYDIALASLLTLMALMIGLMAIALLAAKARQMLKSERGMKNLNLSAGAIMVGAGAYLASRH